MPLRYPSTTSSPLPLESHIPARITASHPRVKPSLYDSVLYLVALILFIYFAFFILFLLFVCIYLPCCISIYYLIIIMCPTAPRQEEFKSTKICHVIQTHPRVVQHLKLRSVYENFLSFLLPPIIIQYELHLLSLVVVAGGTDGWKQGVMPAFSSFLKKCYSEYFSITCPNGIGLMIL